MIKKAIISLFLFLSSVFLAASGNGHLPKPELNDGSILFLENKGQWVDSLKFKAEISNNTLFLLPDRLMFNFVDTEDLERIHNHGHSFENTDWDSVFNGHAISIDFLSAKGAQIIGLDPIITKYNFIHGNNSEKWGVGVQAFQKVLYQGLYEGIDLELKKGL